MGSRTNSPRTKARQGKARQGVQRSWTKERQGSHMQGKDKDYRRNVYLKGWGGGGGWTEGSLSVNTKLY